GSIMATSDQAVAPRRERPARDPLYAQGIPMTTRRRNGASANGKRLVTPQSVNSAVWAICDILRRSNCASALQYVPELTWILFLRILDAQEDRAREEAEAIGNPFEPALRAPYRWQDWAAPYDEESKALTPEGRKIGWKRR